MSLQRVFLTAVLIVTTVAASAVAKPMVEIHSSAPPHGTAPREWLQRLAEAGAGTTRIISREGRPRLEDLGEGPQGKPLTKVHAVLTRDGSLLLPGEKGPRRYRLSERAELADFFHRLESGGVEEITTPRGSFGLTKAEFTDLVTRLGAPLPPLDDGATFADAIGAVAKTARVVIDVDPSVASVLSRKPEGLGDLQSLSCGTALAAMLGDEGLALTPHAEPGQPAGLRIVASRDTKEPWPVGYKPKGGVRRTAPVLMEFLEVQIDGYTLDQALAAIAPRLTWQKGPLPIVRNRFAMRAAGVDPATTKVKFPARRTFYKRLLDQLAVQARLRVDLRVDEAGTPFLWLTR